MIQGPTPEMKCDFFLSIATNESGVLRISAALWMTWAGTMSLPYCQVGKPLALRHGEQIHALPLRLTTDSLMRISDGQMTYLISLPGQVRSPVLLTLKGFLCRT
jgi:hypothetical protein